jgi:hypothetical protein
MYQKPNYSSFLSLKITLTDDIATRLSDIDIPFYDANFECKTNAVYYGNGVVMENLLNVGEVAYFRSGNLKDIFIKNVTAGNNGVLVLSATVPTVFVQEALK